MGEKNEVIRIGHYILGRTIGTGGYAKVKEAQHDLTGVKVAIKIINKRKMRNKNMISKVKREIKILKFINHPNIIKLYEVLDTTNDIFAIMQLASQGELYDYIQANDIDQPLAKFFFKQILSGVQYIHQNLIAHRDLKPENILMDSNGLIKIVDFGLSNLMKDGKLLKTACGSPNYAAPEIVGERKYEGTSVDIWSCGVILYTLIVGSFPFEEQTAFLLYKKIEQGNYTIPSTVSPVAADLISRMLQVDPCKRIKIYQIKNHPWLRFKVPIYCKISSAFNLEKESQFQLDRDIFEQAKKLTSQSIDEVGEEKLIKSIKKRDDESFVITYELMKDEKYRLQDAEESLRKFRTETHPNTILEEVDNIIGASVPAPQDIIVYGRRYSKSPKVLAEAVILALKNLCFEFAIKNADYCIKCVYVPFIYKRMSRNPRGNDSELDEHNEKELKFSKKEIKFTLQIYSANAKTFQHLIDLQLTQGHPLKLYDMITKLTS